YYPKESLKAQLSVQGNPLLYEFCEKWAVRHSRCGKLIVANNEKESASLDDLLPKAVANGVFGLKELSSAESARLEPHVRATRALLSPSTGVVDSHALMARLEQIALQNGVLTAYCHTVTAVATSGDGYRVCFKNPDGSTDAIDPLCLINCAGLQADRIAALCGIDLQEAGYQIYPCKGEYFSVELAKAALVNRLIYPPPLHELTGLGIHATKTLDGRLRLGPNTIYLEESVASTPAEQQQNYTVNPDHALAFYHAVKPFMPFIEAEDLQPEMAGIRPKLSGHGEPFRDFVISEESSRGLPGLINLIGIESPGLTACLSIARKVADLAR
ncbi:MAG: NAD(P)/FAD-dependent oxidoreductase, partial [Dethiobacteria bacterium]|nr:NAD(P)/FAD-dependent oxidoreductase [Dethiobacteria bacterium]